MFVILIRLALVALLVYIFYMAVKFFSNPRRKLKQAQLKEGFYFMDEQQNARKNFNFVYKGVLFEGEKHVPSKDHPLFVHSIYVWTESPEKLNEFTLEDFEKLEDNIIERYPQTKIDWDQPIKKIKQKKGADTPT
ncbi:MULTISPECIES: hypothetical protein [Bacillus]|uniref:hypothetical protein n=1 Tax=Bacillus TaxID=1386 RepID=UPI000625ED0C|nr:MULTISPECIES: hypothetical protein [Bacillus]KOA80907.1 sigma-w pathway protein ysdB [Bacillus stratosphericus]MBW3700815.1 sigma-w pathway protein ysdB [Bacillus aerophilus]AKU33279.1 sigma-w pathway protein ysdB [Bacillus altitudinis]AMB90647.1 sigma-w pathway protein ysdB [Bacillus altitudinis]KAJ0073320.1 sigma-w pathway protein ysdB [Bacillus altitudinis]